MLRSLLLAATISASLLTPVQAAPIDFDFDVFVFEGPFEGTFGMGSLTYDSTALDGNGDGFFEGDEFVLSVTLFGQTFTGADDYDAPFFPELEVVDSTPASLDFFITELDLPFAPAGTLTDITEPGVFSIGFFGFLFPAPIDGPCFGGEPLPGDEPCMVDGPFMVEGGEPAPMPPLFPEEGGGGDFIGLMPDGPVLAATVNPDFGVIPLPGALPMALGGLALLAAAGRRRKS